MKKRAVEAGTQALSLISRASEALAEAKSIPEVHHLIGMAKAAEIYAKEVKASQDVIDQATELRIRAERKLGGMLKTTERAKGSRGQIKGNPSGRGGRPLLAVDADDSQQAPAPSLSSLGIPRDLSSRAQKIASVPEEKFEEIVSNLRGGKSSLNREIQRVSREAKHEKLKEPPLPEAKYRVIYADPPWRYANAGSLDTGGYVRAEQHYPTMSIEELCALKVGELAEGDAVLFLWVTSPLLAEVWPVIKAWGFVYKASFVWDKVKHNFGHYNSVRHELLLVCTRGSCLPTGKLEDSVASIERTGEHSEKPEFFRELIDRLYPEGKRVELFARRQAAGWDRWGNESGR